jgi:hypothetical protein
MDNNFFLMEEILEKYINAKDDDPCICGSGKKFAECHKININNAESNPFEIFKRTNTVKISKRCYFQNEQCNSVYSFSHSIPKQSLINIAENKLIFQFALPNPKQSPEILSSFSIEPQELGITTGVGCYYGFCNSHDTEIFKPLEMSRIIPTKEQVVLTRFRALTKELYTKTLTTKLIPINNDVAASQKKKEDRISFAAYSAQFYLGSFRAIKDLNVELNRMKKDILEKKYNNYSSLVYVFDDTFPIQCCGFINPIFSLTGKVIQDIDNLEIYSESFSLTSFCKDCKNYIVFVWRRGSILDAFFTDMEKIPDDNISNFLVQFILAYSENHAMKPSWWKNLSVIKKKRLTRIFYQDIIESQDLENPVTSFRSLKFTNSKLLDKKKLV